MQVKEQCMELRNDICLAENVTVELNMVSD